MKLIGFGQLSGLDSWSSFDGLIVDICVVS